MKNKYIVFISEPIHPSGIKVLGNEVEIVLATDTSKATAIKMIKDADAVILRATTIFDKNVIEAGTSLKIIARTGVGMNNVDLEAAGNKGIYVCNTPGANAVSVAEHTLALVLAFAKQLFRMDKSVRAQKWEDRFSTQQIEIAGKTAGIIGLGEIGRDTANKCLALGMKVIAYDPYAKEINRAIHLTENCNEIFSADFVLLHCPVTPQTSNIVSQSTLALMKKTAYLINTSRGELVNETALIEALKHKIIAGAALDVFIKEPLSATHPFQQLENLILSPHVAGSTIEANERIAVQSAQAVMDVLAGKIPNHICNKKYLKSFLAQ